MRNRLYLSECFQGKALCSQNLVRWECIGGLYRDNGKENGSYYIIIGYILWVVLFEPKFISPAAFTKTPPCRCHAYDDALHTPTLNPKP